MFAKKAGNCTEISVKFTEMLCSQYFNLLNELVEFERERFQIL